MVNIVPGKHLQTIRVHFEREREREREREKDREGKNALHFEGNTSFFVSLVQICEQFCTKKYCSQTLDVEV